MLLVALGSFSTYKDGISTVFSYSAPISLRLVCSSSLVLALVLGASGCVMVKPHQRALLSKRVMRPVSDSAESKLDSHVYENREAAAGGGGVGAGGCGCN